MYPRIYKIINPVVCKACNNLTQPMSEYLLEEMTDKIYDNVVSQVEAQNIININIETREDESKKDERSCSQTSNLTAANNRSSTTHTNETRQTQSSKRRNTLLRDLIRILILNRLLRPNRPPVRPRPNNMPGGPGPRPPRPGYMPGYGPHPPMPRSEFPESWYSYSQMPYVNSYQDPELYEQNISPRMYSAAPLEKYNSYENEYKSPYLAW